MRCVTALSAALVLGWAAPALASKISDAETAAAEGREREALDLYTEALAEPGISPDGRAAALMGRGEVQFWLREPEAGLADYTAAIAAALDPITKATAHFVRGDALARMRRSDEAIADYTETIRLAPDFVGAHLARANLYRRLERRDEALADYEAELKRHPKSTRALAARNEMLGLPPPPATYRE